MFEGDVFELGIEGDGEGCGEGPGGGGPDDGVDGLCLPRRGSICARVAGELVADVDAGRGVLLVLDLGFGEGGLVVDAPVDGPEAFVDEALLEEVEEGLGDAGLVVGVHGGVGVVPAAEDADAHELGALEVEVFLRVLAAGAADGDGVHLELFAAELLVDFDLDGEAVAVPAGDVGGVEAGHGLGLDDEVLEALVEGVAEVDGAVGVGRAVVEDVAWGSRRGRRGFGHRDRCLLPALRGGAGSLTGRLAFMGKAVWGRFSVDFSGFGRCFASSGRVLPAFVPRVLGIMLVWCQTQWRCRVCVSG